MSVEDRSLMFTANPKPDESFLGYILRLTELNHYSLLSWILDLAGIPHRHISIVFDDSLNLSLLTKLALVDESKVRALMYPTAELVRRKMGNYLVFGSAIQQYLIRPDRPKICSCCLRETRYTRKMWELIPITACLIHKCLLLDKCPNCQSYFTWNRKSVCQCQCEFDWREYYPPLIEENELLVTKQIYQLCNLIPAENKQDRRINSNPLYKLELQHFLSALLFIASQYGGFIDTKGKFIVSLRQNIEIHILLCKAILVFNDWPNNFFSFLDWRRTQRVNEKSPRGLRREFKEYKSALYNQLSSKQFNFIRSAFEEYLVKHWDGGYSSKLKRISRDLRKSTKYLSMNEAKKLLRTSDIYELIASGKLNAVVQQQGQRNFVLVERLSLEKFKQEFIKTFNMDQLCSFLALSQPRVRNLIEANLLNPLRGPSIDGFAIWNFSIAEATNILKAFRDKLMPCDAAHRSRRLTLSQVMARLNRFGVDFSVFVKAVLEGEINPCGIDNNKKGLLKFLFSSEHIRNFLRCKSQLRGEEAYSISELTNLLRTSPTTISFLIKTGFIHARRLVDLQASSLLVKKRDLELFSSSFLIARDIAFQHNTTPGYISELLITHGIKPVSGPRVDGGGLIIFKKSDLNNIDLASLISLVKSEGKIILPNKNRRKSATFNEMEAAKALGIDIDTVEQLVNRGILIPHRYKRPDKKGPYKYCFSLVTINKWAKQSISYTSLVSFSVAARRIGLKPDNFYIKYIRTRRLKAVIAGKKRGQNYFALEDVEEIIRLNKQTITAPEAATICRVNLTCINKLTKAGWLKPISGPSIDGFGHNLYLRADVERLHAEREAFKAKRLYEGGSSRFGRPAGPRQNGIQETIRHRISQLVEQWSTTQQRLQISGQRLHSQLVKEGYQIGINAVCGYLRELRLQALMN